MANWPHERWSAWNRRADEILAAAVAEIPPEDLAEASGPDNEEIRAAMELAFLEIDRRLKLFTGLTI